jgi:hypothetical protein
MNSYRYRVTLEGTADMRGNPIEGQKLNFEVPNHDDLFPIVEKMKRRGDLDEASASALAVGLKLLSEVVLQNRQREPFAALRPALGEFIGSIKRGVGTEAEREG